MESRGKGISRIDTLEKTSKITVRGENQLVLTFTFQVVTRSTLKTKVKLFAVFARAHEDDILVPRSFLKLAMVDFQNTKLVQSTVFSLVECSQKLGKQGNGDRLGGSLRELILVHFGRRQGENTVKVLVAVLYESRGHDVATNRYSLR